MGSAPETLTNGRSSDILKQGGGTPEETIESQGKAGRKACFFPFRNGSVTGLTQFFDLKGEGIVEKVSKKTCENTEISMKDLEIWVRGMNKQGDLSKKAAAATDLALTFWYSMTDEQREDLAKRDSIRRSIQNLIGYGYSWSV